MPLAYCDSITESSSRSTKPGCHRMKLCRRVRFYPTHWSPHGIKTNDPVQGAREEDYDRSKKARRVLPCNGLFAFAFHCDSAVRSFHGETYCRKQVTTEPFTWQVHWDHDQDQASKTISQSTGHNLKQSMQNSAIKSSSAPCNGAARFRCRLRIAIHPCSSV